MIQASAAALVNKAAALEHLLLHGRALVVAAETNRGIGDRCVTLLNDRPLTIYRSLSVKKKIQEDIDAKNTWNAKEEDYQHPWRWEQVIRSPLVKVILDRLLLKLHRAYRFEEVKGIPIVLDVIADLLSSYCYSVQNPVEATCSLCVQQNGSSFSVPDKRLLSGG